MSLHTKPTTTNAVASSSMDRAGTIWGGWEFGTIDQKDPSGSSRRRDGRAGCGDREGVRPQAFDVTHLRSECSRVPAVEEFALLPLCGVPAHRAIRTFTDLLAPALGTRPSDQSNMSDKSALIPGAHNSAGVLAEQMLNKCGSALRFRSPNAPCSATSHLPVKTQRHHGTRTGM